MLEQIQEAARFIQANTSVQPQIGIILGTGLGALAGELTIETTLTYETIPHFPLSTVEFHSGKLLLGTLEGKPVVVMQGRFHYYEGYTMQQVTFPVRVMHALGVRTLLVSNAAGGMNPDFQTTDLMVIDDHIGLLLPQNPLVGPNPPELGDRFPDMSEPYSKALIEQAFQVAAERGISSEERRIRKRNGASTGNAGRVPDAAAVGSRCRGYVDGAGSDRSQSDGHGRFRRVSHHGYVSARYAGKSRHQQNYRSRRCRRTETNGTDAGTGEATVKVIVCHSWSLFDIQLSFDRHFQ